MAGIGLVGSGIIGRGWSIVFARAGHEVALYDTDAAALERAMHGIAQSLSLLEQAEPGFAAAPVLARIRPCGDLDDTVADAVLVQENIPEDVGLKTELFLRLDAMTPPEVILASSTSALPPSAFLDAIPGRRRCLVAHPANPPHLIPVVELVPGPWTAPEMVEACAALLAGCGRTVIRLNHETPGFVFNRLQAALVGEAMRLVDKGVASAEDVESCVRDGLGFRWAAVGPFASMDLASRGGFAESARKYASSISKLWPEAEVWRPETEVAIDDWCRGEHALDDHAGREQQRDLMLIRLQAVKDASEQA